MGPSDFMSDMVVLRCQSCKAKFANAHHVCAQTIDNVAQSVQELRA